MAQATVCDPCLTQEHQLTEGREVDWSLNETKGSVTLCETHLAEYTEMLTVELSHAVKEPPAPPASKKTNGNVGYVCEIDGRVFEKPQGLNMHKMRAHG